MSESLSLVFLLASLSHFKLLCTQLYSVTKYIKMIQKLDYLKYTVVQQIGRSKKNLTRFLVLLWPMFEKRMNNENTHYQNEFNLIKGIFFYLN